VCMSEVWDIYDKNKKRTGRIAQRGTALKNGEYHLVVFVWIQDTSGRYVISKRWHDKQGGGMWETPAGSALAGEESKQAALREVQEEIGLFIPEDQLEYIKSVRYDTDNAWFADYYSYKGNIDLDALVCQDGEVQCVRWASHDEIKEMMENGTFFHSEFHYPNLVGEIF